MISPSNKSTIFVPSDGPPRRSTSASSLPGSASGRARGAPPPAGGSSSSFVATLRAPRTLAIIFGGVVALFQLAAEIRIGVEDTLKIHPPGLLFYDGGERKWGFRG